MINAKHDVSVYSSLEADGEELTHLWKQFETIEEACNYAATLRIYDSNLFVVISTFINDHYIGSQSYHDRPLH